MIRPVAALLVVLGLSASAWADVVLFKDGQPAATIYVSGPTLPEPAAGQPVKPQDKDAVQLGLQVQELNEHFKKLTGQTLPVKTVTRAEEADGPGILLGPAANQLVDGLPKTSEGKEGFRLRVHGRLAAVAGESEQARLFACYSLLRRLGFEWVMPGDDGVVLPPSPADKNLVLADVDIAGAPDFLIRRMWYGGANAQQSGSTERFVQWQRRLCGASNDHVAWQVAGHYLDYLTHAYKKEFDANPQMLALVRAADGTMVRRGPQVETTNRALIELMKQDIRKGAQAAKLPAGAPFGRPIGPADGLGYSQSNEARAAGSGRIDPVIGDEDQTDLLILLGNTLLTELAEEFPGLYVGYYCYSVHADFPMRYKPHPRIAQIFAPITYSRFHAVGDTNTKSWPYYQDVVERWGALSREQGNPLMYRGYNWNLADNLLPFTKLRVWGQEIPFYKKHGFKGASVESSRAASILAPSDFMLMRLLFDSSQDWRQVLSYYCTKAYGAGAGPMEKYHLNLVQRQHGAGFEAGSYFSFPLIYDDAFVMSQQALLDEAARLTAGSAQDRKRVGFVSDSLNMLRLYLAMDRQTRAADFTGALATYRRIIGSWEAQKKQNPDLVCEYGRIYADYFIEKFLVSAVAFSTGPYTPIYHLPDRLPTMIDVPSVGHLLNYQGADLNDSELIQTRTYGSTWDAQGLGSLKKASVWYRVHLPAMQVPPGQSVGLFLGSFDDEAVVYLNGQLIGTSGVRFCQSAQFDLTDAFRPGQPNVLAIQIKRSIVANELGTGGLFRPSFVFAGPRLETKAPAQPKGTTRVLPGAGQVQ